MVGMVNDEQLGEVQVPNVPATPEKLALGAAAELLIASRIALLGYQVYRPLADDRGVDLLVDVGHGRHVAVQVKAVRHTTSSYVYMRKSTFALEPWTVLALVVYGDSLDDQPQVYFVPATEWSSPRPPLTSYDYIGGKSAPEYGLNVRKAWRTELAQWSADSDHVHRLMQQAHTELT